MLTDFFAHCPADKKAEKSAWNPLAKHLKNVGELAASFAVPEMKEICRHVGQWHDLGKYRAAFQKYLRGEIPGSPDTHHAAYGAALAAELGVNSAAFAIAGHHAGLHNPHGLKNMLKDYPIEQDLPGLKEHFLREVGELSACLSDPEFVRKGDELVQEFYVRMLFSCLTDADVLDAKRFSGGEERLPTPRILEHDKMISLLDEHMNTLGQDTSSLAELRRSVHEHCRNAASGSPGFFQLTVPTGGGKTLSAMRFALEHARIHQLERVIVVIPYLSIIEQNAEVYRSIFESHAPGTVVEHHSAVSEPQEDEQERGLSSFTKSAENWDAPIVVTTTVQLIESLFAHSPRRCRKLHNIARSVVLLDEVHTLPYHLLDPLLSVLRQLTANYKTSIVLSTATQPAFRRSSQLENGFSAEDQLRDIIPKPEELYSQLSRVHGTFEGQRQSWHQLSSTWQKKHRRALGIVNTKAQARDWYRDMASRISSEEVFHLSSSLCPEHRSDVLTKVQERLKDSASQRERCYLIATQVVEAGVDIDFPVVYRALGPLDALIQAAGRCNRENKMKSKGELVIFTPEEHALPPGAYSAATSVTSNFLKSWRLNEKDLSEILTDPEVFAEYFSKLFPFIAESSSSALSLQQDRRAFCYREVSKKAKVITDEGTSVVVPYGNAQVLVDQLKESFKKKGYFDKRYRRALQRYMVSLRAGELQRAQSLNLLTEIIPGGPLNFLCKSAYHFDLGVLIEAHT